MKKLLLLTALLMGAAGLHAQSKATAVVSLTTGMTAKIELNNTTSIATLTFTGPSDRWFALQIGSFASGGGMQEGADVVYWNGTTLVDAVHNGVGAFPTVEATNDWTSSSTVSGTTRTIIATRAFNTGSSDDFTFAYTNTEIDFAWAKASTATNTINGHGTNRGYDLNNTYTCIAPAAPTSSPQTFCAGATVANLTATGEAGATFKWYIASTGGTALASTTVLTSTNYFVSQTVGDCESTRTSTAVTITTVPLPSVADTTPEFCSPTTLSQIVVTGQPGATFTWYNEPANGTILPGTTVVTAGNYYVSQTVGACTSARLQVVVSLFTIPKPTANELQSFCSESTVSDLVATGQAGAILKWYNLPTGGDVLAGTTVLVAGDYYVSQTVGDCVSERRHVIVSYTTLALPSVPDETPSVCEGTTIANLTVTGLPEATFTWYANVTGGEPLPGSTVLVNGENYFVSQTVGDCVSNRREVSVTIAEIPAPVSEHNQTFCQGSTVSDLEAEGLEGAILTWHKPIDSAPLGEDAVLVEGAYFVRQTVNGCVSGVDEVIVALLPAPAAPGGAEIQQFEAGETVSDLAISIIVGATVKWYVMDGDDLEQIEPNTELVDGMTYYVTQTVEGCESEPHAITADEILGTPTFSLKNLAVYPNPVADALTVSYNEAITQVTVINMLGQIVISQKANADKVEVDTSKLQNGSYILKVATVTGTATVKIIK